MLTKYSIKTASSVVKRTDWSYFGAESLFAKLRVLKTSVGFFAYLIASSFKYSVTCLWASFGGKPSCSSADFNKLLSLSGSIKYGFIYFSYPFSNSYPEDTIDIGCQVSLERRNMFECRIFAGYYGIEMN